MRHDDISQFLNWQFDWQCVSPKYATTLFLFVVMMIACTAFGATDFGATEAILHSFNAWPHGYEPSGGLISDAAGNLYGVVPYGGTFGEGAIYELTPNARGGWTEILLYSFGGSGKNAPPGTLTGAYSPVGSLVFDTDGNLYGATNGGGPDGAGTIFELTPHSNGLWTEKVIWNFHWLDGANPNGGFVFDEAGNLYGTTFYGGGVGRRTCINGGCGTVFRLAPQASGPWSLTVLYHFQGSDDGGLPNANLAFGQAGHIFGSTRIGGDINGNEGNGVLFELKQGAGGWVESVIHAFTGGSDGFGPSGLIIDHSGNLYGEAAGGAGTDCGGGGCGLVFEFSPRGNDNWNENVLYNFDDTDGDGPSGRLTLDQAGNLYGTTAAGGAAGAGTVFELSPAGAGSWSDTVLWNFTGGTDGAEPYFGVILGTAGQVYGTTIYDGGNTGNGTAFQLKVDGNGQWQETTMSNFADGSGDTPTTNVIFDAAGNLYGTTSRGGEYGFGSVYELLAESNGTWKEKILYNFPSGSVYNGEAYGAGASSLIFDASGNLYGETEFGGTAGYGNVFELSSAGESWTERDLYSFAGGADGVNPQGGLALDAAGNLYGTTETGGTGTGCRRADCGTVFELSRSGGSWSKTTLYNFAGGSSDGQNPQTKLVFDRAGNLYGTTLGGGVMSGNNCGIGCGSVFELSPSASGWKETGIYFFTEKHGDGAIPNGGLVMDAAGNLYGTTNTGGLQNETCGIGCGTAFKISQGSGGGLTESVIYAFTVPSPVAGLVLDRQGNLYGTTNSYSSTVFELSPLSGGGWNETTLYAFAYGNGQYPQGSLILDAAGNLYGTTTGGGSAQGGTVFEILP